MDRETVVPRLKCGRPPVVKGLMYSPTTDSVTAAVTARGLKVVASGDVGTALKFYCYGQDPSGGFVLMEAVLQKAPASLTATLKADSPASLGPFAALVDSVFQ
jgi:hypothetical protein